MGSLDDLGLGDEEERIVDEVVQEFSLVTPDGVRALLRDNHVMQAVVQGATGCAPDVWERVFPGRVPDDVLKYEYRGSLYEVLRKVVKRVLSEREVVRSQVEASVPDSFEAKNSDDPFGVMGFAEHVGALIDRTHASLDVPGGGVDSGAEEASLLALAILQMTSPRRKGE